MESDGAVSANAKSNNCDFMNFKKTALTLEKQYSKSLTSFKIDPAFIKEQQRRESLATAWFVHEVLFGIGAVMVLFMFSIISIIAFKTTDPEFVSTSLLLFGFISLGLAYRLSPFNGKLLPSEQPMDPEIFHSLLNAQEAKHGQ